VPPYSRCRHDERIEGLGRDDPRRAVTNSVGLPPMACMLSSDNWAICQGGDFVPGHSRIRDRLLAWPPSERSEHNDPSAYRDRKPRRHHNSGIQGIAMAGETFCGCLQAHRPRSARNNAYTNRPLSGPNHPGCQGSHDPWRAAASSASGGHVLVWPNHLPGAPAGSVQPSVRKGRTRYRGTYTPTV